MPYSMMNAPGVNFTLFPALARNAGVAVLGTTVEAYRFSVILWLLNVTATLTDVDDTLDAFIDTRVGATWINIAHFTQVLGNGGATARYVNTVPSNMLTTDLCATDCAVGVSRGLIGDAFRGRYTIVNPGGGIATFTFSLVGFGK